MRYPLLKSTARIKKLSYGCMLRDAASDVMTRAEPWVCAMLTQCDGSRTQDEIVEWAAGLLGAPVERIRSQVEKNMSRYELFVTYLDAPSPTKLAYNTEDFLYTPQKIDMSQRLPSPVSALLVLTHHCNFQCRYCYNSSGSQRGDGLSTAQWLDLIDQLADEDVFSVNISGGEPLAHPGFYEIMESLHRHGICAYVSTNGSLLTTDGVRRLADMGQMNMQISLDSPRDAVHDHLTCAPGSFPKVLRAIEMLTDAGITVFCKSLMVPETYRDVEELFALFDRLGVRGAMLDSYSLKPDGRGDGNYWLTSEQCNELELRLETVRAHYGEQIGFQFSPPSATCWNGPEDIVHCTPFSTSITVLPDGGYAPCESITSMPDMIIGRFPEMSVRQAWTSPRIAELYEPKREVCEEPCRSCEHWERCRTGCYGCKALVGAGMYAADPHCWKATYGDRIPFHKGVRV